MKIRCKVMEESYGEERAVRWEFLGMDSGGGLEGRGGLEMVS